MIKNRKVLVTGGAGFIGSHLTNRLVEEGAKVSVIVKYNSIIDCPRLVKNWDKITIIEADLRNIDSVGEMKKMSFDLVFHLAAYNHVGDSFKHVLENVNSNLISTINILNNGPRIENLYKHAIEMIDIGGSTLLRASAKNYEHITTISSPNDYKLLKNNKIGRAHV